MPGGNDPSYRASSCAISDRRRSARISLSVKAFTADFSASEVVRRPCQNKNYENWLELPCVKNPECQRWEQLRSLSHRI